MIKKLSGFIIIIYFAILFLAGVFYVVKKSGYIIEEKQKSLEKSQRLYSVLENWIRRKQQGKSMTVFLKENTYHYIAIYGLGSIGRLLEDELRGIAEISYGIDRRDISAEYPIYRIEDVLPEVDMVIVTAVCDFEEIESMLKKKLHCPIYSIEDIIYFMS